MNLQQKFPDLAETIHPVFPNGIPDS